MGPVGRCSSVKEVVVPADEIRADRREVAAQPLAVPGWILEQQYRWRIPACDVGVRVEHLSGSDDCLRSTLGLEYHVIPIGEPDGGVVLGRKPQGEITVLQPVSSVVAQQIRTGGDQAAWPTLGDEIEGRIGTRL